jgi:RecB family endonuclease NucS
VVARELQTESGAIDAFAVDENRDLYIVETKLYKNPHKRTVVAQALELLL